jgi:amidase
MTLKDALDVHGLRTTVGTFELDRVADEDSTVAARLRAAGGIVVGRTNVPPWLADFQSANPAFGRTADPWDPARTPGGSSGGAAAELAAGLTPLEVGSDLCGSLRLPAHFCGVYGPKTTEHRVPLTSFFRQPPGVPPVGAHHGEPRPHGAGPGRPAAGAGGDRRSGWRGHRRAAGQAGTGVLRWQMTASGRSSGRK